MNETKETKETNKTNGSPPQFVSTLQPVLAGRGRRLVATLIDMLLVPLLTIVLVMITDVLEDAEDYQDFMWALWVLLLAILSYLLLNGYTLWRHGQTLGKRLLGIAMHSASVYAPNAVAAANAAQSSAQPAIAPLWKLICIRALFFPVLFLLPFAVVLSPLALLPVLDQLCIFSKNRRCLHDYASGTVVVRLRH